MMNEEKIRERSFDADKYMTSVMAGFDVYDYRKSVINLILKAEIPTSFFEMIQLKTTFLYFKRRKS
ncbi:hypothetical protein KEH51_14525 [[Brevibacterium] frigoritolerans]|uniref:Uncharacterized protein n=1 Tax=Peribacillus frigoritolerans TaxID=450367 RepID=A0A941FP21_9BACI|nr:hypothetical protein [Peribacillus frigoritolerans]